jgi:hypothetical protein
MKTENYTLMIHPTGRMHAFPGAIGIVQTGENDAVFSICGHIDHRKCIAVVQLFENLVQLEDRVRQRSICEGCRRALIALRREALKSELSEYAVLVVESRE